MAKGVKTGGRVKGTPNKATAEVKEAILKAFDRAGGADYLLEVAKENPAAFLTLLGKVLPKDMNMNLKTLVKRIDLTGKDDSSH